MPGAEAPGINLTVTFLKLGDAYTIILALISFIGNDGKSSVQRRLQRGPRLLKAVCRKAREGHPRTTAEAASPALTALKMRIMRKIGWHRETFAPTQGDEGCFLITPTQRS